MALRPSWNGHLRMSLVSCPISLAPATSEADRISFNQLNPATGNRIALKTFDAETGEPVERSDIIKGYQYEKGHYVTVSKEELAELQIEANRILNLTTFVDRADVDPFFVETPYYIFPEKAGMDAYRVISQAMTDKKKAGIGSIVLSTREHPVMVEPRGRGLVMFLLRTVDEVRLTSWEDLPDTKLDPQMVDMAGLIMQRAAGEFAPEAFRDRYQEALRELLDAKIKGLPPAKRVPVREPGNVVDLMAMLRKSLEAPGEAKPRKKKAAAGQRNLLLPIEGKGKEGRPGDERRTGAEKIQAPARRKRGGGSAA